MKKFVLATTCALGASLLAPVALAQEAAPDCAAQASTKKLAGAALNSFLKKCERDAATASCNASAAEKKLAGAAKTSFTKKCVKDATGKKPQ
ncbi:hypothetical protein OGR47_10380 [Methylocystis sp. MJC1]|jgi:hypothetical protein|uniref:hypothetical protein n=1 Tax=Methylocystis sp. MJC1 TaxID=2654282 RepID=UPI0013EDE3F1|nr:hypothetical protein [Methylocystis sp. MJC1]KAF2992251.1 hypothetical protein MJC1_00629 [Methylocystis sp. MJC1]MBU6527391.1 hypothetical protein [Methylocystis sp. MJC1]UZX10341.1 hypothetical protein OGR47_10380 [Methylocystis sp. MJC1]